MTTFFTDSDLTGAGEFVEAEVWLATEFTVPAGAATFRWRWPAVAPVVTPTIRVYDSGGTLVAGPISFDTTTLSAWNYAGAASPVALSAGTYRVVVNTTRYPALSGFFSGGSITRGSITGVQSRFGSPGSAPSSTSTAAYFIDIDFTPTMSLSPGGIEVPVTLGAPTASFAATAAAPTGIEVPVLLGAPTASFAVTAAVPTGIEVPVTLGAPAVYHYVAPNGIEVPITLGAPTIEAPPGPEPVTETGSWMGLLAVVNSARADAELNRERLRHPVECPYDGWPLTPTERGLHCEFGGHVITPQA